jgi:hypothetical protein
MLEVLHPEPFVATTKSDAVTALRTNPPLDHLVLRRR